MSFGNDESIRRTLVGVLAICAAMSGGAANAAFTCTADPGHRLSIHGGGSVLVDIGGAGTVTTCSLSDNDRGVTKEVWAGWYSTLLSYRLRRGKVRFYFTPVNSGNAVSSACYRLDDWAVQTPYYMEPA